ncbi:MAG: hypothetical protein ACLRT4_01390 [Thomasclavelia sp.]
MAKFERKVERQKSEFSFSKKAPVKKSKFVEFKENFNFKYINTDWKSIALLIVDFLIPSLLIIPAFMSFLGQQIAFIIGHGLITSLLIVISFYFFNKQKPSLWGLLARYIFAALLITAVSFVILLFV